MLAGTASGQSSTRQELTGRSKEHRPAFQETVVQVKGEESSDTHDLHCRCEDGAHRPSVMAGTSRITGFRVEWVGATKGAGGVQNLEKGTF